MIKISNTKRIVIGNLPLDKKYELVDFCNLGDDFTTCDNCGHIIKNVFTIKNDIKEYVVGSECVENFKSLNPCAILELKRKVAKEKKFVNFMNKKCKTIIIDSSGKGCWIYEKEITKWNSHWRYRNIYPFTLKYHPSFKIQSHVKILTK